MPQRFAGKKYACAHRNIDFNFHVAALSAVGFAEYSHGEEGKPHPLPASGGVRPPQQGWFLSPLVAVKLHLKYGSNFGLIGSGGMRRERFKQEVRELGWLFYMEKRSWVLVIW